MGQRGPPEVRKQMSTELKYPVNIRTYGKGSKYYEMTETEMEKVCCIYGCQLYFYDSIPEEERVLVTEGHATLYDIINYECEAWWSWSDKLKWGLYHAVPENFKKHVLEHLSTVAPQTTPPADTVSS